MDYGERCLTPTLQRLCTSQQNSDFFCVPHFLPFLAISGDFWRFLGNFPRCVWSGRANSVEFDGIRPNSTENEFKALQACLESVILKYRSTGQPGYAGILPPATGRTRPKKVPRTTILLGEGVALNFHATQTQLTTQLTGGK